ncbi:unnamed protein product [Linum tenue]|uniref:Uncharacterized protein n=1 Tax=Linum tenue TaxID=586396 RepID=A0AAV0PK17_9ROSI|nr:unnamed protein product [Linum tenue]
MIKRKVTESDRARRRRAKSLSQFNAFFPSIFLSARQRHCNLQAFKPWRRSWWHLFRPPHLVRSTSARASLPPVQRFRAAPSSSRHSVRSSSRLLPPPRHHFPWFIAAEATGRLLKESDSLTRSAMLETLISGCNFEMSSPRNCAYFFLLFMVPGKAEKQEERERPAEDTGPCLSIESRRIGTGQRRSPH